jgi:hypothetical protein
MLSAVTDNFRLSPDLTLPLNMPAISLCSYALRSGEYCATTAATARAVAPDVLAGAADTADWPDIAMTKRAVKVFKIRFVISTLHRPRHIFAGLL